MTETQNNNNQESAQPQTPMMQQYYAIKEQYPDCILFFRMGDFYEMFDEDANIASSILSIVLTKRSTSDNDIAMCGIPYHSYESYLNRLIKAGYKVAICEQMEDPTEAKKRGPKSVVKREVVRVVTSATAIEESLLEPDSYNYLLSIFIKNQNCYLAWLDISSAKFITHNINLKDLNNWLYKINPKEIVVMDGFDISLLNQDFIPLVFSINNIYKNRHLSFNIGNYSNDLSKIYAEKYHYVEAFNKEQQQSIYLLLSYVLFVYKQPDFHILPIKEGDAKFLHMDSFSAKSLELVKNHMGSKVGTLKSVIDYTLTTFGSRMLNTWIENPLVNVEQINQRLDVVDFFNKYQDFHNKIREILKNIPDVQRAVSRVLMHKGSPRDLFLIRKSLECIIHIKYLLRQINLPLLLDNLLITMDECQILYDMLVDCLATEDELYKKNPNYLNFTCNPQLKFFKEQEEQILNKIDSLQQSYIVHYGVATLKIVPNAIAGYYIEIPVKQVPNMRNDSNLSHRQTLSNIARYTSEELEDLNGELVKIRANVYSVEESILNNLYTCVVDSKEVIFNSINTLGSLDILQSFAYLSKLADLIKPIIDDSKEFNIKAGRHLVVQQRLQKANNTNVNQPHSFIANDCNMSDGNIFLITGPNMSGKSTFLRQNALIIVLAQMGCFVPAQFAHIGVVDAIYSRVGASDDLFKGQSTFMVEMLELSIIINSASEKSFLILDEIGRGTSTYDGLAIASASLEYINNHIKARTLFATHYHELVDLEKKLSNVVCYCVNVAEDDGSIIFLYEIIKGFISRSYGIEVAKLAGLPKWIIKKSYENLSQLESKVSNNMDLFSFSYDNISQDDDFGIDNLQQEQSILGDNSNSQLSSDMMNAVYKLKELNVDDLSPKQALNFLYELKKELE